MSSSNTHYQSFFSSLANPEKLDDTNLYQVAAAAHAALVEIQDEYLQLELEVALLDESYKVRGNPRKLLEPIKYREKNDKRVQDLTQKSSKEKDTKASVHRAAARVLENITCQQDSSHPTSSPKEVVKTSPPPKAAAQNLEIVSSGKASPPSKLLPTKTCTPSPPKKVVKDDLTIDMNAEYITITTSKRERKPRVFLYSSPEAPTPTNCDQSFPPPNKKRKHANAASDDGAQAEASEHCSKRQVLDQGGECCETKSSSWTVACAAGPDPVRGEAMRKAWAKRQLAGTNGRHGGAPKDKLAKENHAQKVKAEIKKTEG